MRILLIANYLPDRQESMARFSELIRQGMVARGDEVEVLRPKPILSRFFRAPGSLLKWLGYLDKYLFFPFVLRQRAKFCEIVHICDHANAVYTSLLRGKPHLVTCHDLLAVRSALGEIPENPTGWSGRILQRAILRGLQRAEYLVCVSESTRRDLLRFSHRDPERTSCIPNGLNYPYQPIEAAKAWDRVQALLASPTQLHPGTPFFLHVGGNQWYKHRPGVLRILERLHRRHEFSRHRLVMVGKPFTTEMLTLVDALGLDGQVIELNSVSNEGLNALYSLAEALIFPSLAEGFGWPVIEAQACGCPVFTSNRKPMTEIGGVAACYFDPIDPEGAAAAVASGLTDRNRMVEAGLENARRFDAQSMLQGYRRAYLDAADRN